MKQIAFLFLSVLAIGCTKENTDLQAKQMTDFPFVKVGNESIYVTSFGGNVIDTSSTFEVLSESDKNYQILLKAAGIVQPSTLFTDGTYLYEYGVNGTELNANKLYKKNPAAGDSWQDITDGDTLLTFVRAVNQQINVLAGAFMVDRVASVQKGLTDTSYVYISPTNGIVLQELVASGFSLRLELYEKNF